VGVVGRVGGRGNTMGVFLWGGWGGGGGGGGGGVQGLD